MSDTAIPPLPNTPTPPPPSQASTVHPAPLTPTVDSMGGMLGHAAMGALAGATFHPDTNQEAVSGGASVAPTFHPDNGQSGSTGPTATPAAPQAPGFWQQMEKAEDASATNPLNPAFIVGGLHLFSGALADWANKKSQQDHENNLRGAAVGKNPSWMSPYKDFATGSLRDTADTVHGLVGPKGLTSAAAAMLAPIPAGLYMVGHGLWNMVQGWGDLKNPDILQNELGSASEVAGGAALAGEGGVRISKGMAATKAMRAPDDQFNAFTKGVPPSKAAPYSREDFDAASPLIKNHTTGTDINIKSQIEAADNAIGEIENKISNVIKENPDAPVTSGSGDPVDVIKEVQNRLGGSVRKSFLDAGLKELDDLPQLKDPAHLTLQDADDIRKQLNAENSAIMKSKNNYDFANLIATDPAFAARQAAAETLRSGIYNTLQKIGLKDAQQMRLDEGSVIKVRNAMLRQEYSAEKPVRTATKMGRTKTLIKRSLGPLGAAAGFEFGAPLGHPVMGAGVGARAGEALGEVLEPKYLTRDQLVEKAFEEAPKNKGAVPSRATVAATGVPGTAGQQIAATPYNQIHIHSSDGRDFFIPSAQLTQAYQTDPGLQIIKH